MVELRSVTFYVYVTFLTYFLTRTVESVSDEEFQVGFFVNTFLIINAKYNYLKRIHVFTEKKVKYSELKSFPLMMIFVSPFMFDCRIL